MSITAAGICIVWFSVPAPAQQFNARGRFFQITAGLGVSAHADPSMVNYINQVALLTPDQELSQFASASEFFITPEVQVSEDWSLGLEYSYFLKSYSSLGSAQFDFSYATHMPTLVVHYLVQGDGYVLKFGGGGGYAFGSFNEHNAFMGSESEFKTSGPEIKVEAVGNTEFDENFWGSIGIDLRWVLAGDLNTPTVRSVSAPKLNFFSAGIKFGVTFQI